MQVLKNGFFYVIDVVIGEFVVGNNYVLMNWVIGLIDDGCLIEVLEVCYVESLYLQMLGLLGGYNWYLMVYNLDVGFVYILVQEILQVYVIDVWFQDDFLKWNIGVDFVVDVF